MLICLSIFLIMFLNGEEDVTKSTLKDSRIALEEEIKK